ncbi:MAG: ATP phosphoribosyltransferase regulatory subunit, partial [Chloroflexota bacterium]
EQVEKALRFVAELSSVKGAPPAALEDAERLVSKWGLSPEPLRSLGRVIEMLREDEVVGSRIAVDFGLVRGLAYYTGMVFEVHHDALHNGLPLCGGGRYDGLVRALGGGRDVPALGFAYTAERLEEAMLAEKCFAGSAPACVTDVLVVPETSEACGEAAKVADGLRREGKVVEVEVKERTVRSGIEYARRCGIPIVVIVDKGGGQTEHRLSKKVS